MNTPNFKITREGCEIELDITLGRCIGVDGHEIDTILDADGRDWSNELTEVEYDAAWEVVAELENELADYVG